MYLPILMYHRLSDRTLSKAEDPYRIALEADRFERQLKFLKWLGYKTVRLEDYQRALVSGDRAFETQRRFAITFDDGYTETLSLALPILKRLGMTACVFIVTGEIGRVNRWDTGTDSLMTAADIRKWVNDGMEIGAHTATHPHLPTLASMQAEEEIRSAKRELETIARRPVELFAYPYGEWSAQVQAAARKVGFKAAYATDRGAARHELDLFAIRRVILFYKTSLPQLWRKMQRWYPRYREWRQH